ncbi:MerR family transcriptional regulator [Rhodobacteraceae bacterium RKSG542]|nr:MerR family transcriptional regulator [Pseudovibrio flavus]
MTKSEDAFRTISEVAADLDLPQHVLRFWETRFTQIRPLKRGGGRRYYRPEDIELLKGIRHLLYGEGYTIKGVQRILREQGVKFVMSAASGVMPVLPKAQSRSGAVEEDTSDYRGYDDSDDQDIYDDNDLEEQFADALEEDLDNDERYAPVRYAEEDDELGELPDGVLPDNEDDDDYRPAPQQHSGAFGLIERLRGGERTEVVGKGLSKEDVRNLQATLFELLECKRMLDQARSS